MALVFYVFSTQNISIVLYAPEKRLRNFFLFLCWSREINCFSFLFSCRQNLRRRIFIKKKNHQSFNRKYFRKTISRFTLCPQSNEKGKLRNISAAIGNRNFNAIYKRKIFKRKIALLNRLMTLKKSGINFLLRFIAA